MWSTITRFALWLFVLSTSALAQVTVILPDTTVVKGSDFALPIWVTGFNNVGSFSLTVSFDKNVLKYTGIANRPSIGTFNSTAAATANQSGSVSFTWFSVNPLSIGSGKLLDLLFTHQIGVSSMAFTNVLPSSVTDALGNPLQASYRNGSVSGRTPSAVQNAGETTSQFILMQNYPNPFSAGGGSAFGGNPTTNFEFRISNSEFITLKVFDVLGREVAILVDGIQQAGNHTVSFSASGLPSGVYLCKLDNGISSQTRRMMLVK